MAKLLDAWQRATENNDPSLGEAGVLFLEPRHIESFASAKDFCLQHGQNPFLIKTAPASMLAGKSFHNIDF